MSTASYLLFGILGFLSMLLVQLLESVLIPSTGSSTVSWLAIDGLWLFIIALGLYQ